MASSQFPHVRINVTNYGISELKAALDDTVRKSDISDITSNEMRRKLVKQSPHVYFVVESQMAAKEKKIDQKIQTNLTDLDEKIDSLDRNSCTYYTSFRKYKKERDNIIYMRDLRKSLKKENNSS